LDVVLLKANKGTSKVFYLKGYNPEQSEGQKPDCYSGDGITPAGDAKTPQAKKCATCPHNQWGSRITEKGASKGKACNDTVRMAVAAAGLLNDPMLLRVPPASIRALGEYGQTLAKRGVAYNMVVTKVAFDMDAESPKLTFKPVGFLDDAAYAEVQETVNSDIVASILGASFNAVEAVPAAEDTEAPEEAPAPAAKPKPVAKPAPAEAEDEAPAPAAKPKPAAKTAPKPAPVVDDMDLDLDGISFDD
jgi:hypothetical protein